ncbi:hypothetical protein Poli38472_000861 [Pythium oligandrum]|uniref:Transcription elongation factor Eaf N-terminal domain-containing protein n=1 Tax=Pythium oligandrum TaxID=41045 RepID=A0A8K1CCF0_PYTOL|nr:hypothetical protein Poli38472_000861 [Pythium oligandrum]|eukprot:TMW60819.1 hypothetical protein Poli38472_000861 [Pythium oligandrum]
MATEAPEDEREYRVVLGASLTHTTVFDGRDEIGEHETTDDGSAAAFVTLQYKFQPASVDTETPGLVSVDDSGGVAVLRGATTGSDGGITFKGKLMEQKDTECLLIFDGTSFQLERCELAFSQLRHVRAAPVARTLPATHPAKTLKRPLIKRVTKPTKKVSSKAKSTSSRKKTGGDEGDAHSGQTDGDVGARMAG